MERIARRCLIAFAILVVAFMAMTTPSYQEGTDNPLRLNSKHSITSRDPIAFVISKFDVLLDLKKGDIHNGLRDLKLYLSRFGYLQHNDDINIDDQTPSPRFDDNLESALRLYQRSFNLSVTGLLDQPTLDSLKIPRCGREDVRDGVALMLLPQPTDPQFLYRTHPDLQVQRWNFIAGKRMWRSTRNLTYAFRRLAETRIISSHDIKSAVGSAFASWSAVMPLDFTEIDKFEEADLRIEFFSGDHGDGSPFDGRLGILSHAFAPEDGRFHLDGAEVWTVSMLLTDDNGAVDLETVALHEIGHLIGLDHSNIRGSVMFPRIETRKIKRDLTEDDIEGGRALYGARIPEKPDRELYRHPEIGAQDHQAFERHSNSANYVAGVISLVNNSFAFVCVLVILLAYVLICI